MKRDLVISQLNKIISIIYSEKEKYSVQISYFEYCIFGLKLEEIFENDFKICNKELLKFFNIPDCHNINEVLNYFIEIYNVYHPIRNNIETMDNIESVRLYLKQQ